jgi:phosphoglucosamine mutase
VRKIFGTDGARGVANKEITVELAVKIGRAVSEYFRGDGPVLIGEDTRLSSPMLRNAVAAGIASNGVDAVIAGIIPTPAVSLLTSLGNFCAGVVISASHNPIEYNGIKVFAHNGFKLEDEVEEEIENLINKITLATLPAGIHIGNITEDTALRESYIGHLIGRFPLKLSGLKIAVDAAFGATYFTTIETLKRLGAELVVYGAEPDGSRINVNCGSTNPQIISDLTKSLKADIGISHDGDGDRVIFSDSFGNIIDGDETMLIIGKWLHKKGRLKNDTVVGTVMSNMGIEKAFVENGIKFLRTSVGDRYVLSEMIKSGAIIGGEQSGHIIFLEESSTGDGLITALMLLTVMKDEGKPLSELRNGIVHFPQILTNVRVKDKSIALKENFKDFVANEEKLLGNRGRILVRPSGTEPLIRIMVEGEDENEIKNISSKIKKFLEGIKCVE